MPRPKSMHSASQYIIKTHISFIMDASELKSTAVPKTENDRTREQDHCQSPDADACWICLSEATEACPLDRPCRCPRLVHPPCLARWQLQSAGRSEERHCRFCNETLPDWKFSMNPRGHIRPAAPTMSIHHEGKTWLVACTPGPSGKAAFLTEVRRLLHLDEDAEFEINFECKVPSEMGEAEQLQLRGMSAYDAAVFCASLAAGHRVAEAADEGRLPPPRPEQATHTTTSFHSTNTEEPQQAPQVSTPRMRAELPILPEELADLFDQDLFTPPAAFTVPDAVRYCVSQQLPQPRPSQHGGNHEALQRVAAPPSSPSGTSSNTLFGMPCLSLGELQTDLSSLQDPRALASRRLRSHALDAGGATSHM